MPPRVLSLLASLALAAASCASTNALALDRAVMAYDRTNVDLVSKLLLLNIARAHRDLPMHFTTVSNIAATFDLRFNAGIGTPATGDLGYLPVPFLNGSRGESPTVTISPMQGEEFTRRLLTPFDAQKIGLLLRQGWDVDALLRLVVAELRSRDDGVEVVFYNQPSDPSGYKQLRRLMSHLSSVQDRHALYADPLQFRLARTFPAAAMTVADLRSFNDDPALRFDAASSTFSTELPATGRVVLTNYDTASLTNEERIRLDTEARMEPVSDILVDVRSGYVGGEVPIRARLRLRSFLNVLEFLGRGVAAEPEFDVPPDPRTPVVTENPARSLAVVEGDRAPSGGQLSVELDGRVYALAPDAGYAWNRKAFGMLYQLYQMSVATVQGASPLIIAK